MPGFGRRIPLFPVVLIAAGVAIVVAAALTSWLVLLALFPLAMMAGCVGMMAARRRMAGGPGAARFCCCAGPTVTPPAADPR